MLVTENGELIAGHGRYAAALQLGLETVPAVVVTGLSPARRRALAIADNKLAQNARWNRELLAIEIPELAEGLGAEGLDISILGFEAIEIDHLQTKFEAHAADPQDTIDPKWWEASAVGKPGDLWVLGNHKLLCGDAGSAADIDRLMSGGRADLAFLDLARQDDGALRHHGPGTWRPRIWSAARPRARCRGVGVTRGRPSLCVHGLAAHG